MGKFNNNKDFDTSLTLVDLTLVNYVRTLGGDGEHGRGRQDRGRGGRGGGRRGHRGDAGRHTGMGFGSVLLIWIFICVQYLY